MFSHVVFNRRQCRKKVDFQPLSNHCKKLQSIPVGVSAEAFLCLCESQAEKWTEEQRDRFFDIASECGKETLSHHHYTADCMHKRNRYVVDQADFIAAVWDGRSIGMGKAVQYAQQQGKPLKIINPKTMLVE